MHLHFQKRYVWMAAYILIILYAVSSFNVLLLILGLWSYMLDIFLETNILGNFAFTSFFITTFVCIYHVHIMFHKRKRKTDTDQHEKIGIKKIWLRSRILNKLGFILVCIYAVIAGYMFLWMFGGAENILKDRDMLRIGFSLISFAIAALIALYHLATWVFRQKRATDHGIEVDEHGILINTSKNQ